MIELYLNIPLAIRVFIELRFCGLMELSARFLKLYEVLKRKPQVRKASMIVEIKYHLEL